MTADEEQELVYLIAEFERADVRPQTAEWYMLRSFRRRLENIRARARCEICDPDNDFHVSPHVGCILR